MPFVNLPPGSATPATPPKQRDIFAVTAALQQLDASVAKAEQAATITVPGKGLFGGSNDARDAAVAGRVGLLQPAAKGIKEAIDVLNANAGYRSQPMVNLVEPLPPGYRLPIAYGLGDNGHDIVSISTRAAANPIKHKWANDFPWQSQPTTDLAEMVDLVRKAASEITRGEARISLARVTSLTADLLYDQRADQLDAPRLQQLQDAVTAVRTLGDSRFADDALRGALEVLPTQVLVDGELTTDPASLAALEQLHRSTVVDTGSSRASASVAAQLAKAQELAVAGDTAGAREIYEQLAADTPR